MKTNRTLPRTALLAVASLSILLTAAPTNAGSGYALSLDGVNDWVDLPAAVIPASGDFTVECWVRCPTAPNAVREILSQGSSGNAFYIGTDAANNFRVGDTWTSTGVPFPVGDWHHIAVVNETGAEPMTSLYVDGERQGVVLRALANPAGTTGLRLGRQYGSHLEYWPGQIDEVRVWAVARSTTEILAHMERPLSGSEPHLVAYWRCNENGGEFVVDAGPHGYTGLPQNGPAWVPSGIPFVPEVNTGPATNVTLTGALLSGTLSPGNLPTTAAFQWGPDPSYGRVTATENLPATNAPLALTAGLSNLAAGVTYHFRLVATNAAGITLGTDATFGTVFPASVATLAAGRIGLDQATLNGTVNPHGLPSITWFEWGTDTTYGNALQISLQISLLQNEKEPLDCAPLLRV